MGAVKQTMLEEMDNNYESGWTMLRQLEPTFFSYMTEYLPEEDCKRLYELSNVDDVAELTEKDQKFLSRCFDDIEEAYHYQDVATKND